MTTKPKQKLTWLELRDAVKRIKKPKESEIHAWARLYTRLKSGVVLAKAVAQRQRFYGDDDELFVYQQNIHNSIWNTVDLNLIDLSSGELSGSVCHLEEGRPLIFEFQGVQLAENAIEDLFQLKNRKLKPSRVGRPPGNWWPDVCRELAIHIARNHKKAEEGSLRQGHVVDAILDRLAILGLSFPNRSSVAPIVQDILDQLKKP